MEGMVSVRLLLQSLVLVSLRIVSGPLRSAPQVPYALKEDLAVFVRPWMGDMWLALFSMGKKPMISLKISGTSRCVSSSVLQGPKLSSAPKEPDRSSEL
ncbi:hypothetical protein FOQG_07866 [Fusarium oxysporum f. sp. raphani 54005]|uniref:Uncharacterized protein n=1 Tax=Fusarium oxysporum f. sp. raphani 54005 TaxID=1089458 RepID=X0D3F4_FUSOX|nr:hypothetical protein FOQG_07866 [Fusarium oxysporum f. sp. raphani 54005]